MTPTGEGIAIGVTRTTRLDESRWQARPVLARALSLTVFVVPVAGSYVVTRLAAPLVSGVPLLARIIALGMLAIITGFLVERVVRRVLPLAALLRMTMLFPDHAPSRYRLARAAGNTGILTERARNRPGETAGEAATRILGLLTSLGAHDRRTRGHSERVRVFTDVLAAELHLTQAARDRLRWASLLHDLGKIGVPATVLNKPGALLAGEWDMVRQHPDQGAVLAGPLLEWLGEWGTAISQHHERFDGMGYPRGLAGHEISHAGRIVAVADVFEVMTAARSYKRPMSVAAARRQLAESAGTQLDPACVRAFLGASLPRVLWAVGPLALLANLPFLRQVAEAGRVVEHAGTVAAGQATTVAVAATTAVVLAVPATGPAVIEHHSAEPRSQGNSSVLGAGRGESPTDSDHRVRNVAVPRPRPSKAAGPAASETISAGRVPPLRTRPSEPPAPRSTTAPASEAAPATSPGGSAADSGSANAPAATSPGFSAADSGSANAPADFAFTKPVALGSAASFAILAGSAVTNTGLTLLTGSVGLSPGVAVTGLLTPPNNGVLHAADDAAVQAKADLAAAYDDVASRPVTGSIPVELGGTTVTPGVYASPAGTFGITGTVTLDAGGDPNAVFIFRAASTLITASASRVKLVNGAQASNVFWLVGSSATLGTYSVLRGNVLALASITVTTGTTVDGRLLAHTGAVTLDTNVITRTPGGS